MTIAARRSSWPLYVALGAAVLWNLLSWQFPFFWDNILNSRIAHWYLDTNFSTLMVPETLDAGHPPFFSLYIAGLWAVFGKSLAVAHAGMLPFLLAVVWAWWKLCGALLPPRWQNWGLLVLLLEPTWLAQSSMVTPDLALLAGLLVGLVGIMERRAWLVGAMALLMAAVTFRGILLVPALYLMEWAWHGGRFTVHKGLKQMVKYLPVAALTAAWLAYHWQVQGWLLSPPAETYGGHREVMGLTGILRNGGLIGWRFLDFGRVFLWVFLLVALLIGYRKLRANALFNRSFRVFIVPTIWLALLLLPFSNPIGHRYFLFGYLFLGLLVLNAVDTLETRWRRWLVPIVLGIGLFFGNAWIYPSQIAQGWDATLAHTHFFVLQSGFYADHPEELPGVVGADFPLLVDPKYVFAEDVSRPSLVAKDEVGWENCTWMLETNVSNGFADAELAELRGGEIWELEWEAERLGVYLRLYRRK